MDQDKKSKVVKFYYNISRLLAAVKEHQEHLSVVQTCENRIKKLTKNEDGLSKTERDEHLSKWKTHQAKSQQFADNTMEMAIECYDAITESFKPLP